MKPSALVVHDLHYAFDSRPVLEGVSLTVREGEQLSIIGPNGAGKSTLIRCINRVLRGWTGDIQLFGRSVRTMRQRDIAKLVGYVPQPSERSLPYTVFDFVLMGRYPHQDPFTRASREDREIVRRILHDLGVDQLAKRQMDTLSGGERQVVCIASALAQGARMLLLDEPTAFLDYRHQVQCADVLRRLKVLQGVTIISVTHDVNQAVALSDRVAALKQGRLVFEGLPELLITGGILHEVYDIPFAMYGRQNGACPLLIPQGLLP